MYLLAAVASPSILAFVFEQTHVMKTGSGYTVLCIRGEMGAMAGSTSAPEPAEKLRPLQQRLNAAHSHHIL